VSATRRRILIDSGVKILPKLREVYWGRSTERGHRCLGGYEHPLTQRN